MYLTLKKVGKLSNQKEEKKLPNRPYLQGPLDDKRNLQDDLTVLKKKFLIN